MCGARTLRVSVHGRIRAAAEDFLLQLEKREEPAPVAVLRALLTERLTAAAEEIVAVFEQTVAEYEGRAERSERERRLFDAAMKPRVRLHRVDVQRQQVVIGEEGPAEEQQWSRLMDQEDSEAPHFMEEPNTLPTSQEKWQLQGSEETDIRLTLTSVAVKSEEDEEEPQSSQLNQCHSDENRVKMESSSEPVTDSKEEVRQEIRQHQASLNTGSNNPSVMKGETEQESIKTHTREDPTVWTFFGKRFSKKNSLKRHLAVHTGDNPLKTFSCPDCGRTFRLNSNLSNHRKVHRKDWPLHCSLCDQRFPEEDQLQEHMLVHVEQKPLSFPECGKGLSDQNSTNSREKRCSRSARISECGMRLWKSERKSYSADYKLQVVKYAAESGNRAAERKFGVSEKLVRDWRKAEATLSAMKKTKKANRGLKARWPELEEQVHRWALEQRAAGRGVSGVQLRLHAQVVAKEMNISDFAGGPSWCYRFMQRNRLSFRARATSRPKLPADFHAKADSFRQFVEKQVTEHNISLDRIINMDEVPLTFDIPMGRSVAEKRQKGVNIVTCHEKSHFTVVLACCGDGSKLPPMVIFKRKTIPKDTFPPTVVVAGNEKGWMDQEMMNLWLTECYTKRPDGLLKTHKALLVMDSMRAHITSQFKDKINACNSIPTIIPGGLTKVLQPLDISVKRSFKAVLRRLWEEWMVEGERSFTATGRRRHATLQQVVGWIEAAWTSVTTESILSGFRKAGLTGTDAECDDSPAEEETALHLPPELAELLRSYTEDEEFSGFSDVE